MTGSTLDLNAMDGLSRDAQLLALADEMSDALSRKMVRMPGMTPQDQMAVQMIALSRVCSVACTTLLGGYEINARACADVLYSRIMDMRANAERAVGRAYTLRVPKEGEQ